MTALFTADAYFQILVHRSTTVNGHIDQLADALYVQNLERIVLQNS